MGWSSVGTVCEWRRRIWRQHVSSQGDTRRAGLCSTALETVFIDAVDVPLDLCAIILSWRIMGKVGSNRVQDE